MTETEKIKELLKLNNFASAIIVDEEAYIYKANDFAFNNLFSVEIGKSLYNLFDKNTSLLVKNNFIDVKTYKKIQRRKVSVLTTNATKKLQLIISPFSINDKKYFYVLIFDENAEDNLIAYPTIDDSDIRSKYRSIFEQVSQVFHHTLIEKKNFQFSLDVERVPITIRANNKYIFVNDSFTKFVLLQNDEILEKNTTQIFELPLAEKFNQVEETIYSTENLIVVESTEYLQNDIQQKNRTVFVPIFDDEKNISVVINFGGINPKRSEEKIIEAIDTGSKQTVEEKIITSKKNSFDEKDNETKIIYDKNTFKILETNNSATELYGYSIDELLKMDITELCLPEDMQKLLAPISSSNESVEFTHIKNDESNIIVEVIQENIVWRNIEAVQNLIRLKEDKKLDEIITEQDETEVKVEKEKIIQKSISEDNSSTIEKSKVLQKNDLPKRKMIEKRTVRKENKSDNIFLSSLFHELLTPVNVILGFVQEIIDGIDKPTDEQAESAEIIKSNKQLLLQTMNTAVQYAQVSEGFAKQNIEEFEFDKYLLDLKDSVSRISEKENVEVNFEDISNKIILQNDRKKILATISYFLKFAIRLTSTKKINIDFETNDNKFSVLVTDGDKSVSEKLASEIIEIYIDDNNLEKNNFRISPITIKLARKLTEITSGEISRCSMDGKNLIVLSFPITAKYIEDYVEEVQDVEVETNTISTREEIVEEVEIEEIEVPDIKIEDEIIDDIAKEKEIDTEEIATIEEVSTEEKTIAKLTNDKTELSKYSCLLIEDSIDSQLLFKTQMKDFKLLKIANGLTEALPLIQKYNFDLIYVDINLQGQYNGLDALKIIRQFENYKSTPIIAVTSYPFEGDKSSFISAGFNDYFIKPLLREQLLSSIDLLV
ncbi:MAG: response regulator [Melioribacteraceae bacterium]